ncbi:MAG: DUF998 domain-containing protein [Clostridia bacterium]|nr:DUF998 domain-containing protein [Clostridia bacterium]
MMKGEDMSIMNIIGVLNKEHECVSKSYLSLRRWIGILGILLPLINILGGWFISRIPVQSTISSYYYTNMRDFFVGILCVVSLFLITYDGYNRFDQLITSVAGVFGLGVAIIPCRSEQFPMPEVGLLRLSMPLSDTLHLICAVAFFTLLAIISIFLFTMTGQEKQITKQKRWRNIIYVICGVTMLLSLLGAVLCLQFMPKEMIDKYRVILVFETLALFSFGISWLIKGETLIKDRV